MKIIFRTSIFLALLIFLSRCNAKTYTATSSGEYLQLDSTSNTSNPKLTKLIQPYSDGLEAQMNRVLNQSTMAMIKNRPEGLLSNFAADLVFEEVNELPGVSADFCLLNHGGLRSSLPEGDITVEDIYQLMPFDNQAVVLELTAEKVLEIAHYLKNSGGEPISHAEVNIGENVSITVNGNPIQVDKTYKVITSDYLANGGDKMTFFDSPVSYYSTGIKIRDMIIEHIEEEKNQGKTLNTSLDGRIHN